MSRPAHPRTALTAVAVASLLVACGGGGAPSEPEIATPASVEISGLVADGPIAGAMVCYDLNRNGACDTGEPAMNSDTAGRWRLQVLATDAGRHAVIAQVPANAIDVETGAAFGAAFTLKSPPTGTSAAHAVFVSPLSTLVVDVAASQGSSVADAAASVQSQLGLVRSPLANFVEFVDVGAARVARVVTRVITGTARLADAAGASADAKAALVASVAAAELSTLAGLVKAADTAMPVTELAAQVADKLLAERNLSAATAAAQAAQATLLASAPADSGTPGPFVSVRRFTYTDAGNHVVQAFVGNSTPGTDGSYKAHEVRVNRVVGEALPFNRNQVYWVAGRGAWETCALEWEVVTTTAQTATMPQKSSYCGASRSSSRVASVDVGGRRMADVVREMRASPLRDAPGTGTDASGLPTAWGPDPALLGETRFPAGAIIFSREQVTEIGDTERFSLTDKPRVIPASGSGSYRQARNFDDLRRMRGNWVDAAVVVTSANTIFLDDLPATLAISALSAVKRWRAGFDAGSDRVRFYACDVLAANNTSQDCVAMGEGTLTLTPQADARVLRFASGYPAALTTALKRQRLFVERSGVVFGGARDLERKIFNQRPNTVAWNVLRGALNMAELPAPTAPAGPGPFAVMRSFSYSNADNWSLRTLVGDSSQIDAQGYYLLDDRREGRSVGAAVSGAIDRVYWTGSAWQECLPTAAASVNSVAPFDSLYCGGYAEERHSSAVSTIAGRTMADVVQDIRWYATKEGSFDYAGWGPSPGSFGAALSARFPLGATMEIRGNLRKATPIGIAVGSNDKARVAPADTSLPFATWPYASSMDHFIAAYAGNLKGGSLNGATAFWVWGHDLAAPPAPEYTTRVEIRVAFDAVGQRARFSRNYRSVSTGFTAAHEALLDTTYTVQTLGGLRVLSFAALPAGFERDFGFQRMFVEREGAVWYAFKDVVPTEPIYSIRLNGVAGQALREAMALR